MNFQTTSRFPVTHDPSRSRGSIRNQSVQRLPAFLNLRAKSLIRANLLVFASLGASFFLSDFPRNRPTLWLIIPVIISVVGLGETIRCLRRRWSLHHAAVVLFVYMDLMIVSMLLFMLLYPYTHWLTSSN